MLRCATKIDSSDEDGELLSSSNDEDDKGDVETPSASKLPSTALPPKHRMKTIWSSVLADQSSDDISSSLGTVGMKKFMSRGPESFSLELAYRDRDEALNDDIESENIACDINSCHNEKHIVNKVNENGAGGKSKTALKRKRTKEFRKPGNNVPQYKPGQIVKLNKRNEIYPDDSEEKVADELIFRLWEKKRDLLRKIVSFIGVPTALILYGKTEIVEQSGGLMTLQGDRRRTPGGTFLHLLRNHEGVDQNEVNRIFEEDSMREREQWMSAKRAKKQAKQQDETDQSEIMSEATHEDPSNCVLISATPRNSPSVEMAVDTAE